MEIFGRPPSSYRRAVRRMPQLARQLVRAARMFRKPWRYVLAYFFERRPASGVVEFRDGLQISLSSHPRDVATVFVVFIKGDYGTIPIDRPVVDIGANIGCFSLYAARHGARRVFAFEPSLESFHCLCENIRRNRLEDAVVPFRLAVTKGDTTEVAFPTRSDPSNRIPNGDNLDVALVPTITIDEILARHVGGDVGLMKIDCEGAEYDIVTATSHDTWQHVAELRIEYHDGRPAVLIDHLERCGFILSFHASRRVGQSEQGDLWFHR